MQVLCKASNIGNDVRCPVCGQGFLVYWTRTEQEERARRHAEILHTLREQHTDDQTRNAHPAVGFNLPEWEGEANVSAVALLGSGPTWATV